MPKSLLINIFFIAIVLITGQAEARRCEPTPQDEIGPFYRPNAPLRSKIGSGYLLSGVVRDAMNCKSIAGARIEVWLAGPAGAYGDDWRATLYTDRSGRYRIEMNFPPAYARRPPHVHILVDIKDYAGLVTQHYPKAGQKEARFDLVLERE
ncbi:MAG: intradiol ring-cleavage dioxygenase [Steroidobacteraceae bacterium]|nr:intradiol ring-cleavage dioxygenase [Deltaproteobacteria bacterium]